MSRVRRNAASCAAALTALVAGCGSPTPPTANTPTPASNAIPTCGSTASATSKRDDTGPTTTAATSPGGDLVLVAVDPEGRPEIVSTDLRRVAATATALESQPGVDVVALEPDQPMTAAAADGTDPYRTSQWALDDLGIETAWSSTTGSGVDIAVVDTGVSVHPDLAGRTCSGVAFLDSSGTEHLGGGIDDENGHGTHVAGIALAGARDGVGIAGVAPSARLVPVRVLDANGSGSSSDVARGIIWAVDHGAEIVNLSVGGPSSVAVERALAYAEEHGVVVVAAAGNEGPNGPANYPAAFDTALAVASYDQGGGISWFSTRGAYVDVAAPGSGIVSTARDGGWIYMSGTSMATPHVAGIAALLRSAQPSLTPAQLRDRLRSTARDAGPVGPDAAYGWGRVDPVAALRRR